MSAGAIGGDAELWVAPCWIMYSPAFSDVFPEPCWIMDSTSAVLCEPLWIIESTSAVECVPPGASGAGAGARLGLAGLDHLVACSSSCKPEVLMAATGDAAAGSDAAATGDDAAATGGVEASS